VGRGQVTPVGRDKMDVISRQVSSTHASRGRLSIRSELFSSGKVGGCGVTTRFSDVGLAATVLTLAGGSIWF
jgi:hypothetical protein